MWSTVSRLLSKKPQLPFEKQLLLGHGAFGAVYVCVHEGVRRACKVVQLERVKEPRLITNEIEIWKTLQHPNICRLHAVHYEKHAVYLICELALETLYQRHVRMRRLGAKPRMVTLLRTWSQITAALAYLHARKLMHRDLKSENVLICDDEVLKVTDFGLAKAIVDGDQNHTSETGSYRWMSPEVIRHERYDERCDIYSLAMLFYETLTLSVPFKSDMTPVQVALGVATQSMRPPLPPLPTAVQTLIEACWSQDATARPPSSQILLRIEELMAMNVSFSSVEMSSKHLVTLTRRAEGGAPSP